MSKRGIVVRSIGLCEWDVHNIPIVEDGRYVYVMYNEKKTLRETQTLRAGCSKAEPKKIARRSPQTPFSGEQDGQNLISWRSLPLPTNPVWWGLMHAISSYRAKDPQTQTNKQTHRQDRLQYTAPLSLARSVISSVTIRRCSGFIHSFNQLPKLGQSTDHTVHVRWAAQKGSITIMPRNWTHFNWITRRKPD